MAELERCMRCLKSAVEATAYYIEAGEWMRAGNCADDAARFLTELRAALEGRDG